MRFTTDERTLSSIWTDAVGRYPDQTFLEWWNQPPEVVTKPASWTYEEFDDVVAAVAGGLRERGLHSGGRVHLVLSNSPAFVACWLAASRLGACIVAADPRSTAYELARQRHATRPEVAVVDADARAAYVGQLSGTGPGPATVLVRDDELTELRCAPAGPAAVQPCTPAGLLFTSGTTSEPKAVVVTQANYGFAGEIMAKAANVTSMSRLVVCLPLFHANAQYYSFAAAIARGAAVVLLPRFSASTFIARTRASRATHASLFAAPIRMILARTPQGSEPATLTHCWYAQNLTATEYEDFALLAGCRPRQLYGMTETIAAVLTNPADRPVPASMGYPTQGCAVELRTKDGRLADTGEEGEVLVRGIRGITLFDGYLDDPEATAVGLSEDGVLATGDFARRDADGYYYFVGRRSDVLKVGGENVSSVEVEAVLAEHPDVAEVAVVGRPDEVLDEVPVAFLVLRVDAAPTADRFANWCAERLAPSKRPRDFRFVTELPRTSVGKIRKVELNAKA